MVRTNSGYLAAIIGAGLGGLMLGLVGVCLGFAAALALVSPGSTGGPGPSMNPSGIVLGTITLVPGVVIGQVIGCWLALDLRGHDRPGATARYLAALSLTGVTIIPMVLFTTASLPGVLGLLLWLVTVFVACPALARWVSLPSQRSDHEVGAHDTPAPRPGLKH